MIMTEVELKVLLLALVRSAFAVSAQYLKSSFSSGSKVLKSIV